MRTPVADADIEGAERTGSIPRPARPVSDSTSDTSDAAPATEKRTGSATAGPAAEESAKETSGSDWFAPRKPLTNGSKPAPSGGGTPGGSAALGEGPAGGGGTLGGNAPLGGPSGGAPANGAERPGGPAPTPPRPDLPYFSDGPQPTGGQGVPRPDGDDFGADDASAGGPRPTPSLGVRTQPPGGPTTGPVTGTSSLTPNLDGPAGPGGPGGAGGVPPRMSDDTAVLTPQFAAPAPAGPDGNVSGDTLTSGIPVVPPEHRTASPFPSPPGLGERVGAVSGGPSDPMGTGPAGPGGPAAPARPEPASSSSSSAPAKKGRSKLVLLGVGIVGLVGVAYGAGLLMNHSEVPKGTTVLGVEIGGGTKDDGVAKLEAALGKRAQAPLQLSVAGKKTELVPDKAGLSLDSQATVRAAAGSDYNPVSVIGSLFGNKRKVDPVIPVDEEKLGVALKDLAGVSGSASDGTIKFEPGKVTAVPGKPGKSLDVDQSMISVRDAYRTQVQTGRSNVVELPVTTREPTISQAELDRAMKEFAKPAMSDVVTIKAGPGEIQFGPLKSLPQILSMVPVEGKLVPHYNKKAIDELSGSVFDGVMITKGDGKKHQLNADDVAAAMQGVLLGKTTAERTAVIDLDGNG
ncbi:peptidoglycan binding domain-containing protein [Streptomyces sp. NPDC014685]|uniref:peptidoglycan binding domain-containing protein n=1 Tax=Streptomyces sp. NPDC014685 TaxID=3364881 RepID=UPI0037015BB7